MTTSFPTPDEVKSSFQQSIQPIIEAFRTHIHRVLTTQPPSSNQTWLIIPGDILGGLRPFPGWAHIMAAFKVVQGELDQSGWIAEYRDGQRDSSIIIRPKGVSYP